MPIILTDVAELAAELSRVEGIPLAEARALAERHIGHLTRDAARPDLRALLAATERERRAVLAAQARRRAG